MNIETILAKQQQYMWGQMNYYRRPISMARGQGMYLWDIEGKQYLDMFGGILSVSCGHCHPKVTEALVKQVQTLVQCSSVYPHEHAIRYAEMLAEITPPGMTKSYFGLSGTEAVENAVKLACQYTGRSEIIAVRGAYHGLSGLAVNLTAYPGWRPGQILMPGIRHAVQPNCYRCAFKLKYPSCGVACAWDIEEIIQRTTSGQIAAFIGEPVAGVSGLITPPVEYFKIVRDIVHKYGGLFIADEVQTMFGRTGKYWYGCGPLGRGARHHGHRQEHRQRHSPVGRGDNAGDRRRHEGTDHFDLPAEPGLNGRGHRRPRSPERRGAAIPRRGDGQ